VKLDQIPARSRVMLMTEMKTLAGPHAAGGVYKVLGYQGSMVRLSRESDRAKLTTTPDVLCLAPRTAGWTMDPTQAAYACARAAAEVAREQAETLIKSSPELAHAAPAEGERTPAESDEVWERIEEARETVREGLKVYALYDAQRAAEKAMVAWALGIAKSLAPSKCPELHAAGDLDTLAERAWARPAIWTKLVDIAFRFVAPKEAA
jgi:hypothetical protein